MDRPSEIKEVIRLIEESIAYSTPFRFNREASKRLKYIAERIRKIAKDVTDDRKDLMLEIADRIDGHRCFLWVLLWFYRAVVASAVFGFLVVLWNLFVR